MGDDPVDAHVPHATSGEEPVRARTPDYALLAAFNVLDDWFSRGAAEVNTFLHVVIEFGPAHPLGRAAMGHLAAIRGRLAALAQAAGLEDPEGFAWSFHILTKGAMVASMEGDHRAAVRARNLARALIDLHRPDTPGHPTADADEEYDAETLRGLAHRGTSRT
jgi:hypothetical protein